jgi:large subunit ribosomal protein L6
MSVNKNINSLNSVVSNKNFNSVIFKSKNSVISKVELLTITHNSKINDLCKLMPKNNTVRILLQNKQLGTYAPFTKTFIIRGIGFQADVIDNTENSKEFPYNRYLLLRVGHSFLIYKSIPNYIGVKVSKKDRKIVVYGVNKEQVSNFSKEIFKLRPPSVYTGRGIRIKKGTHRRKLGKKDIRKGKV